MELINAKKIYKIKNNEIAAINNVNLKIDEKKGGFYVIMGHSGSGKSTLIQILGLLDNLTDGDYIINDKNTKNLSENEKALIRKTNIGFVFQNYHLNPYLKAYENVILPMYINENIPKIERKKRALELLELVNLSDRTDHYPKELSGGEQQRVAIARALANDPKVIIADEPTGNLDVENERIIFELLKKISEEDKCVIVVSHNETIKKYADYIYKMENGKIIGASNENNG